MRGKSRFCIDSALLYARLYPSKKAMIICATEVSAKEHRKALADKNGGARPFNVKVRALDEEVKQHG